MKQAQFFKYSTLLLLALNLALIGFFLLTKPRPPMGVDGLDGRLVEVLKLDKDQHETFLKSAEHHSQQMRSINESQRKLIRPYFSSLIDSTLELHIDSVLQEIQVLEGQKVTETYNHFKEVKSLLRDDQQGNFEEFMNKALQRLLLNNKVEMPPRRK